MEKHGEQVVITDDENAQLMRGATNLLNEYKFYSLAEKSKKIASAETQEQINEIWNSFDTENQEILSDILSGFKFASELDIQMTNNRLKSFSSNMHWDIWFMLKLISYSYSDLDDLSTTMKREFFNEIEALILKYKELPNTKDARNYLRFFLAGAVVAEFDKQGRINITQPLIKYADLVKDCIIIGVNERLEIWSKDRWGEFLSTNEDTISDIADKLFAPNLNI